MNTLWEQLIQSASRERFRVGASVFRIVSGFAVLVEYLVNYRQRHYLFGPDGLWPWDAFVGHMTATPAFSVYSWSRAPLYFEACYHLGIVVALLWMLGWRTRWLTPLNAIFWFSMHQRFPSLWDGGDNLMRLVIIYGLFADLGAYFSVDAQRRARSQPPPQWLRQVSAMFHNTAILAFALQMCLVYGVAGLYKVQGETWREGTALYYAMRGGQFEWVGVSQLFYQNALVMTALSYGTVAFQISFPFLLFMNRYTRLVAICIGLSFHVGIALFMGLITFSMFMMAVDLALIDDDEYQAVGRWLKRLANRFLPASQSPVAAAVEAGGPALQTVEPLAPSGPPSPEEPR